jgi:hypothetical protein
MPRISTCRGDFWGTGKGKTLARAERSDDWRTERNRRKAVRQGKKVKANKPYWKY